MARQNVFSYEEYEGERLVGWFDPKKSRVFEEETRWDGNNNISVTAGKFNHETLYYTKSGRWVIHWWSQWQGSKETYKFLTDEQAKEWLLLCNYDAEVEEIFGELEEERGPGRPRKPGGGHVQFRLDGDIYPKLEELAEASGQKPADFVRNLVVAAIGLRDPNLKYCNTCDHPNGSEERKCSNCEAWLH